MSVSVKTPAVHLGKPSARTKFNHPNSQENALKAQTLETIKKLRKDPSVLYAEANFIRKTSLLPNDEFFKFQWHYTTMNLPQAWDVTTGSDNVIVAVIDSGIVLNHPDLAGRLIAGFDFISDLINDNYFSRSTTIIIPDYLLLFFRSFLEYSKRLISDNYNSLPTTITFPD